MKTLLAIALLALAPAGAIAGGVPADPGPKAALDARFAAQFGTNITVEAICLKTQPGCRNGRR